MNSIYYVDMDIHKENYTFCCYSFERDELEYKQTVAPGYKMVLKYLEQIRIRHTEEIQFVCGYEAVCLGYTLYRQLTKHGVKCVILAPTTMAVTNTNRIKADKRDAGKYHKLTHDEKKYNRHISSRRVTNKHAIGFLKRFKILAERYRNRRKRYPLRVNLLSGNGFTG